MSNAVFLRPDENGEWGQIGTDPTSNMSEQLVFQSGATAIGAGTVHEVGGYAVLTIQTTITATATVAFEASQDGTLWVQILSTVPLGGTGASQNTTSSTSVLRFAISSVKYFRARVSSYTSGTVDVIGYASTSGFSPQMVTGTCGNSDTNSATTVLTASGEYNLLYDGTNWTRQRSALGAGDGSSSTGLPANALYGYNGTAWDRLRTVSVGDGIGTGLLANGNYVWDATGLVWNRMRSANSVADATTGTTTPSSIPYGFNGATFDRIRVGKVYKYIEYLNLPTSTSTTVWTPSSGKKFRLMGVSISTSASVHLHLRDSGTIFHTVRPLATTATFDFGNGYLSALVGNVLEIRNDSGTTTNVWVTAWGTEE